MVSALSSLKTEVKHREPASGSPAGQGRRVLVITYNWPPDASVGGVRPLKVATQLRANGWEPIVLTVKDQYYGKLDPSSSRLDSEFVTIRTGCLPTFPNMYLALRSWFRWFLPGPAPQSSGPSVSEPTYEKANGPRRDSTLRRMLLSLMYTPDEYIGWLPFAVMHAWMAMRRYDIACVVSTGPPFTAHIAALCMKRLFRVPWIAEFRDPWASSTTRPAEITSRLSTWLDSRLERAVINRADRVVCVTPATTGWYRSLYAHLPSHHWETITNGFTAQEFGAATGAPNPSKFTISYLGALDYGRSPELLFRAVQELSREGILNQDHLSIRFVGVCHDVRGRSMMELVNAYGLNTVVTLAGTVPRHEALNEMRCSHVLLLLVENQQISVPAKTYEYIGAGRRILAITEKDGATADVLRRVGGGIISPGDIGEMKRVLHTWYHEYRCGDYKGLEHNEQFKLAAYEYEWSCLGRQYAALIESVC